MVKAWAVGAAALALCACSSVDTKFGSFSQARARFQPSAAARACTTNAECIEVDYGCHACCPGGAAINRKFTDIFNRHLKHACTTIPTRREVSDCTCVSAPVKCLKGLCTWDYQGPDPSAL